MPSCIQNTLLLAVEQRVHTRVRIEIHQEDLCGRILRSENLSRIQTT